MCGRQRFCFLAFKPVQTVGLHAAAADTVAPTLQELHAVNPCAGKKDGTILPSAGCSATYYQCWRGKPVSPNPKCAAGTVFNPKATPAGCSYVGAVGTTGCNCAAAFKGERATACTICQVGAVRRAPPCAGPWPAERTPTGTPPTCTAVRCCACCAGQATRCAVHVASRPSTLPGCRTPKLQAKQKEGVYPLYNKPWPRYVECSVQGPFVMPCNTGACGMGAGPPAAAMRAAGMLPRPPPTHNNAWPRHAGGHFLAAGLLVRFRRALRHLLSLPGLEAAPSCRLPYLVQA